MAITPDRSSFGVRPVRGPVLVLLLLLTSVWYTATADSAVAQAVPARYSTWLEEVESLLTEEERSAFLSLHQDFRRDAFIDQFWKVRDPYPQTGSNEFREIWEEQRQTARQRYGGLEGDRARVYVTAGEPDQVLRSPCADLLRRLEIWSYFETPGVQSGFDLVFILTGGSSDPWRLWPPREGLDRLIDTLAVRIDPNLELSETIANRCPEGQRTVDLLARATDWQSIRDRIREAIQPNQEWISAFLQRGTDLPEDSEPLPATLEFDFPARYRSRTVVQGVVLISKTHTEEQISPHEFVVDADVLRKGEHFESFRYRFSLPDYGPEQTELPLVLQRYLRPGTYEVALRVEDRSCGSYWRTEQHLEVPLVIPPALAATVPEPITGSLPGNELPPAHVPSNSLLAEANAAIDSGEHTIRLLPPPSRFLTGRVRLTAEPSGEGVAKVAFELNERQVMSKRAAPFSVEIDLGETARLHTVAAVAYDAGGIELARDEIGINSGPHRFAVRLLSPRPGMTFRKSLRAFAEVELPVGKKLDRLEFYLNETLLTTLYQAPFVQPILVPDSNETIYVRALAHLEDGNTAEDLVFVNAPENLDEITVDFVELYTSVVDRRGHPVEDVAAEEFVVLENGVEQTIRRFENVRDLPVHTAVLLDTSSSMQGRLEAAERAALRFFERVVEPKDRAAVMVFNDAPLLRVPLTNDLGVLAGGLVDLRAEGNTTLYDSLIHTLYYLGGVRGKRAIILITDGDDSHSRHDFSEALGFAQHLRVAVYPIGIALESKHFDIRSKLQRLASETGGSSFFIDDAGGLERIYDRIETELRSELLIGYQSSSADRSDVYRRVEVQVRRPGLKAKTIPGYFP